MFLLDAAIHMKRPLLFIAWPVPQKRHGQSMTLLPSQHPMAIGSIPGDKEHAQKSHRETKSFRLM
jgi:hypothetical protein